MSHASAIVALSPEDLERALKVTKGTGKDTYQEAVAYQMLPFDENGEWFKDGTRWDWWQIGGRYHGRFPGATNQTTRRDLTESLLLESQRQRAAKLWQDWEAEKNKSPIIRGLRYNLEENDTLETVTARFEKKLLSAYVFLKDRRWCEFGRLGWFGTPAPTECEIAAEEKGEDFVGRCITRNEELGAQIVTWDDPDPERWYQMFWPRFIRNLPPETVLICVDYHV